MKNKHLVLLNSVIQQLPSNTVSPELRVCIMEIENQIEGPTKKYNSERTVLLLLNGGEETVTANGAKFMDYPRYKSRSEQPGTDEEYEKYVKSVQAKRDVLDHKIGLLLEQDCGLKSIKVLTEAMFEEIESKIHSYSFEALRQFLVKDSDKK